MKSFFMQADRYSCRHLIPSLLNRKLRMGLLLFLLTATGTVNAQDNVNIGKSNIRLQSDLMTPEALWAMGRIGGVFQHQVRRFPARRRVDNAPLFQQLSYALPA